MIDGTVPRGRTEAVVVYRDGRWERVDDPVRGLAAARDAGGFVWTELDHPDIADFADIEKVFDLHSLAVEDAVEASDRPKLDLYDSTRFFTLTTLRHQGPTAPLNVGRVMVFVGDAFVVTVRQEDGDTLERVRRRVGQLGDDDITPLDVLYAVLDTVVDDVRDVSRRVEESILATAERLFSLRRSDEAHALYRIAVQLLKMAHAVQPLIEPLRHLSSGAPEGVDVETARRLRDVLDHAVVLVLEIGANEQLVEHLRSSNDSRIALQQNTDMRKISGWAAIIAVPTAITGFYGMNVPYPGFGDVSGLVAAIALQVGLAVLLFFVFRRRGWL